jgi:hypothetical protein
MSDSARSATPSQPRRALVTRARVAQLRRQREREPAQSERAFAADNDIPRSTLRGLLAASPDNDDSVAVFFASEAGAALLHRILLGLIVVFVVSGAGSLRQVEAWLRLVTLHRFIAPSPSALHNVRLQVEEVIAGFDHQQRTVANSVSPAKRAANARCGAVERSRRGSQRVRAKTKR